MALYGSKYVFEFISCNGDLVKIDIQKKGYSGMPTHRPIGRSPILKRERNDAILGTSVEIYAECRVDAEYAELYTSSADDFKVDIYKGGTFLWSGFVAPELYSEPDIAPPYDVQIIATDCLGELKSSYYTLQGAMIPLSQHLQYLLSLTSLDMPVEVISSLKWDDDNESNSNLLDLAVNLDYLDGERNYDVLQNILKSFNACITQQNGKWIIFREADLYDNSHRLPAAVFGSMNITSWWPIGNLSTDIVPARHNIKIKQDNHYKDSLIPSLMAGIIGGWEQSAGTYYDSSRNAYVLAGEGDYVRNIQSYQRPLSNSLTLHIKAAAIKSSSSEDAWLSYMVRRQVTENGVAKSYWLVNDYGQPTWVDYAMGFLYSWKADQIDNSNVVELQQAVPLSVNSAAESIEVTVQNYPVLSKHSIALYDVALSPDNQKDGIQLTAAIANNARGALEEEAYLQSSADGSLPDTMYGVLMLDGGIRQWYTPYASAPDLLRFLARDYAMVYAYPRLRYKGVINVPSASIPFLFERDNTYYVLNTYSLDLLNDEMEVELVSIPNAAVSVENETVEPIKGSGGGSASSGGGGTGGGGSDIVVDSAMSASSENPVQNKVIKAYVDEAEQNAIKVSASYTIESINGMKDYWFDDEMSDDSYRGVRNYVIKAYVDGKFNEASKVYNWLEFDEEEQAVKVKFPLYSVGSVTAGGKKEDNGGGGGTGGIDYDALEAYLKVNEYATQSWVKDQSYAKESDLQSLSEKVDSIENNGVDLTGYATEQWVTDQDYATNAALKSLSDKVDSIENTGVDLTGYATEQWVKDQGYVTSSSLDDTFTAIYNRLAALEKLLEWFEFDENEDMIKAKFGIYSVGAITAGKKKEE